MSFFIPEVGRDFRPPWIKTSDQAFSPGRFNALACTKIEIFFFFFGDLE